MPGPPEIVPQIDPVERASAAQSLFGLPAAWKASTGSGITVGIVDSGIDAKHPDLEGAVVGGRSFVDGAPADRDDVGHGTHVAGIIAARANRFGIIGIAPECALLAARVVGRDWRVVDADRTADAVHWCVDEGADVLCLSLAWPRENPALVAAIANAVAAGIPCVCASGNRFDYNGHVGFPASHADAISVGSVAVTASGVSVAPDTPTIGRIDIYAPGVGIVSTFPARRYARWSGTSMAAPFVAGAIALAFARADASGRPRPGRDQLLAQLRRTGSVAAGQGVAHRLVNPKRMFDA